MNSTMNDPNIFTQEQREQREQASNDAGCKRSPKDSSNENKGNNAGLTAENPVDTEPVIASKPEIKRPCFMSHDDWIEIEGKKLKPGLYYHYEEVKDKETILID